MGDALPILTEHLALARAVLTQEREVTAAIVCPVDGEEIPARTCPLKEWVAARRGVTSAPCFKRARRTCAR